jgi:adenylate kinase family enzyme
MVNYEDQMIKKGDIKIIVEKVHVEGNGVILLTGPSSCGKGEIAKSLCKFLSIPEEKHLSMGDILRMTVSKARKEKPFRERLALVYDISDDVSIFDHNKNKLDNISKAEIYKNEIESNEIESSVNMNDGFISQLDWLEFCITKGLLVPDEWTVKILDALLESSSEFKKGIFILDGYPRTKTAAEYLLKTLSKLNIPVIKVLHLAITKEQMKIRAQSRKRFDDTDESLERRYQFYIDKVQPCIDYLKYCLGVPAVALIDAHQPVYNENGQINIEASIHEVTLSVMQALGLPRYLLDIERAVK